ncbi:MAG: ABC transporter substrate-binding protein, partial [Candidatus Eremiobacteraeota bacterium]|nr:ABC transporter substrate-binding protein [Candidatus Eremiobacteraeota bacterium]
MDDQRTDNSVDRREFLRRTGALGIAGASVLGFPLLETRAAGAAPLLPPRDVIAAGGGATVKIGHLDGFSGVYAAASQSQQHGMEVAVAEAMRKNNRIKYEIVKGDDTNKPATGTTEAKRLISQEKVDVLTGCLSSAVGLAVSATAQENNTFFLAIGTHDTNITGPKAHRVTFRQTTSNAMLANAVAPELLKHGKKWYFLVADYAFGTDGAARAKKILLAQGGTVVGEDLHKLGETDYSSYLTKARNTDANVLFFSNYGPDCQNATKAAVQLGLNKKMTFGGILCGNDVAVGMPVDELVGSLWGYVWGPEAGGNAQQVYNALKPGVSAVDWRQYL